MKGATVSVGDGLAATNLRSREFVGGKISVCFFWRVVSGRGMIFCCCCFFLFLFCIIVFFCFSKKTLNIRVEWVVVVVVAVAAAGDGGGVVAASFRTAKVA